jgi:uncharacterized protein (TIGR00369 family)
MTAQPLFEIPEDESPELLSLELTEEELVADLMWPNAVEPPAAKPRAELRAVEAAPERKLTLRWADPAAVLEAARGMSGRQYLEAVARGELPPPPIAELLGMEIVEVGDGRATFATQPREQHYNPIGVVHGGLAATLLDSAMGCAVQSTLETAAGYTTLELKVNFTRPMTSQTGRVFAEAQIVHRGSRVATAEARLISAEDGKLLAHGTSTLLILGD